jgi:hypothetical protein
VPATHDVHTVAPCRENEPIEQAEHAVTLVAPASVENEPGRQAVHAAAWVKPVPVRYVPASQVSHADALLRFS